MTIESAADRLAFLSDWDTAVWNGTTTVSGLFNNGFVAAQDGQIGVESAGPTFTCRSADVSGLVHGHTLLIDSVTYVVRGHQPDGTGMTEIVLEVQ